MVDTSSETEVKWCIKTGKKKEVHQELELTSASLDNSDTDDGNEMENGCGVGSWRPSWLQMFAKAEVYAVAYAMLGFVVLADATYFVGTLSTVEKYFKLPSRTTGFMQSSFELGSLVAMPIVGYAARHLNPIRLVFSGTVLTGFACMSFALPYFIFAPVNDDADTLNLGGAIVEHTASTNATLTNITGEAVLEEVPSNCDSQGVLFSWPVVLFCAANVLIGIGTSAHYTVGFAYLDNNANKNRSPILLAAASCVQMFGAALGYAVSAMALSKYVHPTLTTTIDIKDTRWVGAWWLGWPLMGALTAAVGCLIALFPRRLATPRGRRQRREAEALAEGTSKASAQDLKQTIWKLLSNKVLVFNTCSTMCLMFGYASYWSFLPKYIEVQFHKPAAEANVITGSVNLIFTGTGVMVAAIFITRFKPHPRKIAAWNVLTEMTDVIGHFTWAFLGCSTQDVFGTKDSSGIYSASCNTSIVCGSNPLIQPICSREMDTTFYSPCFAGCSDFNNETKIYSDCACIPNGIAEFGPCSTNCGGTFIAFITVKCILNFLQTTGHSGNMLLAFRCVDEKDKSLSIALTQIALSVLVFFPAPTIYGVILDSTCQLWKITCGSTGNCLFYDKVKMRYLLNFIATGFLFLGVTFDIAVWKYCSGLQIYEEDDAKDLNRRSKEIGTANEDGENKE